MIERSLEVRRLVIGTDIVGYGSQDGPGTRAAQQRLIQALDETYRVVGVRLGDRGGSPLDVRRFQGPIPSVPSGDSTIDLLPPGVPEALTVSAFVRELPVVLAAANRELAVRTRLRVAITQGTAAIGPNGATGRAVTPMCRLRDSDPARTAMELVPEADLVVLLSDDVYVSSVVDGEYGLAEKQFRRVSVAAKPGDLHPELHGWLQLPGHPPPDLDGGPPRTPRPDRRRIVVESGGLVPPDGALPPAGPL